MSARDKSDLARGWKGVEKLADREADRVARLSDAEFDREMAAEPAPAEVPSLEGLLRKATARAAADPQGVRAVHGAVSAKEGDRSVAEQARTRPTAARVARRWGPSFAVAAAVLFALTYGREDKHFLGSAPDEAPVFATQGTPWVHYVSYFLGGVFLTNAIPHLASGLMGRAFQTPFADPPGEGRSSSTVNVLWGALNLAVAYLLLRGSFDLGDAGHVSTAGAGALVLALVLARRFGRFHGGNDRA